MYVYFIKHTHTQARAYTYIQQASVYHDKKFLYFRTLEINISFIRGRTCGH